MCDPYRLDRFVTAQDDGSLAAAVAELRRGRKTSHWMWFVFPQLAGLGRSDTARFYALGGLDEARAYLAHPVLGPRLVECAGLLLAHRDRTARDVLGSPDDVKLRSSMTLFARADPGQPVFRAVLDTFFDGEEDGGTTGLLAGAG